MIGKRLAEARKKAGLFQVELAAAMGAKYDQKMVSHVERGRSGLRSEGLAAAATELGVSTDWLLGLTDDPTPAPRRESDPERATDEEREAGGPFTPYTVSAQHPIEALKFRDDWLSERRINLSRCTIFSLSSDSMEPTLPKGCSILVDRSLQELHDRHIYVMRRPHGLIIKRVQHAPPHGWLLISDNVAWPIEVMDDSTVVVGEVKWYSASL